MHAQKRRERQTSPVQEPDRLYGRALQGIHGKYAKVEHIECVHKGHEFCRYIIAWDNNAKYYLNRLRTYLAAMLVTACTGALLLIPFLGGAEPDIARHFPELLPVRGEEAIEYLKNNSVDLVLLGMTMDPGIDGLETYLRDHPASPRTESRHRQRICGEYPGGGGCSPGSEQISRETPQHPEPRRNRQTGAHGLKVDVSASGLEPGSPVLWGLRCSFVDSIAAAEPIVPRARIFLFKIFPSTCRIRLTFFDSIRLHVFQIQAYTLLFHDALVNNYSL